MKFALASVLLLAASRASATPVDVFGSGALDIPVPDRARIRGANPSLVRTSANPTYEDIFKRVEVGVCDDDGAPRTEICLNEECVNAASNLFKKMDLDADPCEDFNQFACGNFHEEFQLPEDKSSYSSFTPLRDSVLERGRKLMESKTEETEWEVIKKAKAFYRACMDEERLEELGTKPVIDRLAFMGGWPLLEGAKWEKTKKHFKWYEAIQSLNANLQGKNYLVSMSIGNDDRNSSWRVIHLDQPSLGLSREYFEKGLDDKYVQAYYKYMQESAVLLGADPKEAEKQLKEALQFELDLAMASAPREERRDANKLYNPFILKDFPSLEGHPPNWAEYINGLIPEHEITEDERIIVVNPDYIKKLSDIIAKASPRVIANYLGWRVVSGNLGYTTKAARDIRFNYKKVLTGVKEEPPRWETCLRAVGFNSYSDSSFRIPIGTMYVQKYFGQEAKAAMLNMIDFLRSAFVEIVNELDWMDDITKERARDKMDKMGQFIAYPDEILDRELVENHHQGIEVDENDYLGSSESIQAWSTQFNNKRLYEEIDKRSWIDNAMPAVVNAFYNSRTNSMVFPAGILQGVFFNYKVPRYLNFGGIGAVIGHEITHGFDDQGRQFDADGNLNNWWEPETKEKFVAKAKCIIEQYSNYTAEQVKLNLNGINGQGENIADNGGTKEAIRAYQNWMDTTNGGLEEPRLPGLQHLNSRQMFWVSWGQVWCAKYRDAALERQIKTGAHSPGPFRIIGPLSNSEDFARDFNCPLGSKMNPEQKCPVW